MTDIVDMLRWRGIRRVEDACRTCRGSGIRMYGNTATWRGGIGGAQCTNDVCDACWGSGDRMRAGPNLRQLQDEEDARVAAAAVGLLADAAGATLSGTRLEVHQIVRLLIETADKEENARSKRYAPHFPAMARNLARHISAAMKAKEPVT